MMAPAPSQYISRSIFSVLLETAASDGAHAQAVAGAEGAKELIGPTLGNDVCASRA